ncbi:MAG: helix-turn-helix transcriptional regulator [Bacteroidales bacterium]
MVHKDLAERARMGRNVAALRKERGISQVEMARLTGLDQSHISRIEAGRYNVTFDVLHQLASVLGMRIELVVNNNARPSAWEADALCEADALSDADALSEVP